MNILHGRSRLIAAASVLAAVCFVYFIVHQKSSAALWVYEVRAREVQAAKSSGLDALDTRELAAFRARTAAFKNGFIKTSQVPSVLSRLSDAAKKNHIQVVSVDAQPPAADSATKSVLERLVKIPIRMRFQGSVRSLGEFFRTLSSASEPVFVVEWLTIKKSPQAGLVDCEVLVSFFSEVSS